MQGWKLFKHALRMVLRNWREAIRIFLAPTLLFAGGVAVLALMLATVFGGAVSAQIFTLGLIAGGLVFVTLWTVVAWHRFVVLEEYPAGWLPIVHKEPMLSYLGRSLLLGLLCIAVAAPFYFSFGQMAISHSVEAFSMFTLAMTFAASLLMYRLVVALPAAAIGERLSFFEAFSITKGATGAIAVLLVIVFLLGFAVDQVVAVVSRVSALAGHVLSFSCSSVLVVLHVSILTTLYGHYVEGRSID